MLARNVERFSKGEKSLNIGVVLIPNDQARF